MEYLNKQPAVHCKQSLNATCSWWLKLGWHSIYLTSELRNPSGFITIGITQTCSHVFIFWNGCAKTNLGQWISNWFAVKYECAKFSRFTV